MNYKHLFSLFVQLATLNQDGNLQTTSKQRGSLPFSQNKEADLDRCLTVQTSTELKLTATT